MADLFKFRRFEVRHRDSALKVGTDAVLLGAGMTIGDDAENALDIGTGCGVIALMLAQRTEGKCRITGIDIDGLSAEEAAWNFARSPWGDMLSAQHCSLGKGNSFIQGYTDDATLSRYVDLLLDNVDEKKEKNEYLKEILQKSK